MPWKVFAGSMLTMLSLFIAFFFNYTILGQPHNFDVSTPPFGRIPLQPLATLLAIALLLLGLLLVFTGLKKMEAK
jgi:hypothetical protein